MTIVCTYGTLGVERFDELLEKYHLDDRRVIILVDEDERGIELRKQLNQELSHAENIYITSDYKEVATTPQAYLAMELIKKNIEIDPIYFESYNTKMVLLIRFVPLLARADASRSPMSIVIRRCRYGIR